MARSVADQGTKRSRPEGAPHEVSPAGRERLFLDPPMGRDTAHRLIPEDNREGERQREQDLGTDKRQEDGQSGIEQCQRQLPAEPPTGILFFERGPGSHRNDRSPAPGDPRVQAWRTARHDLTNP